MAYLNLDSSNLFLGLAELKTWSDFLDQQGFRKFIRKNSSKYGLFKNSTFDSPFDNGKVEAGTNSGTIKINAIEAIDKDGNFIVNPSVDNIAIVDSPTQFYWIRITHAYSNIEKGTVSIDSAGNLTGTGTEFLSKLRGQSDFPSKIRFVGSTNNTQEYDILDVFDNNNAIVQGFFTAESNLRYEVVGTFTPGVAVQTSQKFPFNYDSCNLEIIAGGTTAPAKTQDYQFYLARVRNNGGVMIIEDKRTEVWESISSFELKSIPQLTNKFIGIEAVKFNDQFTPRDANLVELAWGLRSSNWTASNSLRQITIANGQGGVFKRDLIIDPFVNGDFNGWRLYFENGNYARITESAIDAGAIKVTLDRLNPDDYNAQEQIFICPDVEEVGITFFNAENFLVEYEASFPVNTPLAKIPLVVSSETTYEYVVNYRYKNNNQYSRYSPFPDSTYFAEASFDEFGEILINPAEWVVKNFTNTTVELVSATNSFFKVIERVDKGDKFGVTFRNLSNASPLITLVAGQSDFYQKINYDVGFILTTNHIINFSSEAKDGNEFFIFMKGPFQDTSQQFTIQFRQDYISAGTPGILLLEVNSAVFQKGNLIYFAVFDKKGTNQWSIERMDPSAAEPDIGEIVMYSGSLAGKFDSTGLGLPNSLRWNKWALCNGQNGTPDLRSRFVGGFNPLDPEFDMGQYGGSNSRNIELNQMPPHRHFAAADIEVSSGANSLSPGLNQIARGRDDIGNGNYFMTGTNQEATIGRTSSTGGINENQVEPFDNRPGFYALAFVMKIQ